MPKGRGFDSRWFRLNFLSTYLFWMQCGPPINSVPDENEYQDYFLGIKAVGA
jgi:hypothetical protein